MTMLYFFKKLDSLGEYPDVTKAKSMDAKILTRSSVSGISGIVCRKAVRRRSVFKRIGLIG